MNNSELILMVNTFLLSAIGMALSLVSFFLKDLYRDYKKLTEQVQTLHRKMEAHERWSQEFQKNNRQLGEWNREQIERLLQHPNSGNLPKSVPE